MDKEQKKLLAQDLSWRLGSNVVLDCCDGTCGEVLESYIIRGEKVIINEDWDIDEVKPVLIKMEDLTPQERQEFAEIIGMTSRTLKETMREGMKYLISKKVDINDLIPQGLAIHAKILGDKNPYK